MKKVEEKIQNASLIPFDVIANDKFVLSPFSLKFLKVEKNRKFQRTSCYHPLNTTVRRVGGT